MPEGHLIHRYAREHRSSLAGRALSVSSPQGRFAAEAAALDGSALADVDAYGKHLFYRFAQDAVVHVHLGMAGFFERFGAPSPEPRPQVRLRLATRRAAVDLIAPAACRLLDGAGVSEILNRLGPDPLRADARPEHALALIASSTRPVASLLLDQSVVAGLGNVLRAEVLFLNGIHPLRTGRSLSAQEAAALWQTARAVMRDAVERGRILTLVPPGSDAATVAQHEARYVYKQERCRRCGTAVEQRQIAARTAYWCPRCQPAGEPDAA